MRVEALDIDDNAQWDESENDASFVSNIYATIYNLSDDFLKSTISAPEQKAPRFTFSDDVAFTKGDNDDEFFFDIPELDSHELENYDGLYTSLAVVTFGPNYIYATKHNFISSSSYIYKIVPSTYTIDSPVRY